MARTVLITGTRKGLGQALAGHYLAAGWQVAGCSRAEPDWSAEGYRHFCLDVAEEAAVTAMIRALKRDWGQLDAVINNAGAASMNAAATTPLETVERLWRVNFAGAFLVAREASKVMLRQKSGRIVNLSTVAVPLRLEGEAVYGATKAALEHLTQTMAAELGPNGITVNSVGPGPIETDLTKAVPRAKLEALLARQAIPQWTTPADVARVTDFFLAPENRLVTGQTIYLGGVWK